MSIPCVCSRLPVRRSNALFTISRYASSNSSSSVNQASSESTSQSAAPAEVEGGDEVQAVSEEAGTARQGKKMSFNAWLDSKDAQRYKRPAVGRTNWIGKTPFPLNPSFRPPTPLSDVQKTRIYQAFAEAVGASPTSPSTSSSSDSSSGSVQKSESYYVRKLALRYNLSMDRIRAIVRLKALEANMKEQGKELQGKFMVGMESALGVTGGGSGTITSVGLRESANGMVQETRQEYAMGKKSHWIMLDEEAAAEAGLEGAPEKTAETSAQSTPTTQRQSSQPAQSKPLQHLYVQANAPESRKRKSRVIRFEDVSGSAPKTRQPAP